MKKGEATKLRIVKAATRLFATHGYDETSFQMIANALKLSQSAVMHHFGTKIKLFEAVIYGIIGSNTELLAKSIGAQDDALAKLRAHLRGNLIWAVDHDYNAPIMMTLYQFAGRHPEFQALYTAVR